jgi:two-component system cell cycle sensor histidine kinase/response regulator CckA
MSALEVPPNFRVLVIDDTRAIHDDFRKILGGDRRSGDRLDAAAAALFGGGAPPAVPAPAFEVDFASQGQEGLALAAQALGRGRPYALAFVDVRMPPGWDGIETIERIWRIAPDLQAVVCTAYSDYSWDQLVARLGHSDRLVILKKPFDPVEVLQLAVALTEKWRLTQQARATIVDLEGAVQARSRELESAVGRLRASEEKFSRAFRLHPDGLSIHRLADGKCIELNPGFTRITGYSAGDTLEGRGLFRDWGLWAEAGDRERLQADLRTHGEVSGLEGPLRRQDGTVIRCQLSARVVEIGGEACVLALLRDLTAQRRLEAQLAQSQKLQAVGQLAGGIAHDYNNVLTATLMQLHLLLARTDLAPAVQDALRELERMAHRSASLTRQLLAFSRQQRMRLSPLNLNETVGHLLTMLRRLLGENIELAVHLSPEAPLVEGDVGMIEQLATNLCVNARDAMLPRGGRLTLRTGVVVLEQLPAGAPAETRPGRFAYLAVTDTGHGMDAATLAHVFEPFFTTKATGQGTGLGLATVYGIAQQHRGWVEAESEPGAGSTFRVLLPALPAAAAAGPPPAPPPVQRGHETILLVEDEAPVREIVGAALRECGYRVHEAADGRQALAEWTARARELDLLLSDMVMPNGVSGMDVAEGLQKAHPGLRVILSSGYSAELTKRELGTGRGLEFLSKPYTMQTLTNLVRKSLEGARPGAAPRE